MTFTLFEFSQKRRFETRIDTFLFSLAWDNFMEETFLIEYNGLSFRLQLCLYIMLSELNKYFAESV